MEFNVFLERLPFIISVAIILYFIAKDSIKIFGKTKTFLFFLSGIIYSVLRANFIGFIMQAKHNIPPILPYEIVFPLFKIFGTTPVEIAGWLIVSYLSLRFSKNILKEYSFFHQVILSSLMIASFSFAIETTAILGDWWRWRLILGDSIFGRVPTVGIIDWAFVSFDFLFPFVLFFLFKSNILLKIISLLIFPLHMIFHLSAGVISENFPTTWINLFHIIIPFLILLFSIFLSRDALNNTYRKCNDQKMFLPRVSTIIIIINLFLYNLYFIFFKKSHINHFEDIIGLFLPLLPLIAFFILDIKNFKIFFLIISLILSIFFKEAIPSLILIFSFYFLIIERKINVKFLKLIYLSIPFLFLLFFSFKEGVRILKINKAIEEFNDAYNKGLWAEAKEKLEGALSLEHRHPVGNFLMAEYYLKKENNPEKAKYFYQRSLNFYQYFKESYIPLIQIYLEEKNLKNAEKLFKNGYPFYKEDPVVNYLGYRIYKAKGDERKAEKFLKEASKLTSLENMGNLHLYTILNLKGEKEAERVAWGCLKERKNLEECALFLWEFYSSKNEKDKLEELQKFMENLK